MLVFTFGKFKGGGWCNNATTCLARRDDRLGSSKKMVTQVAFSGMLSNKAKFNPGIKCLSIFKCCDHYEFMTTL